MADQPQATQPVKRADPIASEFKALNLILTGIRMLLPHRRGPAMKYINDLLEKSGVEVKE